VKSFITLIQGVFQNQPNRKKVYRGDMIGYALLEKDNILGKKYWVSWDGEGYNKVVFDVDQPLVFPPEKLQIGTRLHLLSPEE